MQYEHQVSKNKLPAYLSLKIWAHNISRKFKSPGLGAGKQTGEVRTKANGSSLGLPAAQVQIETTPGESCFRLRCFSPKRFLVYRAVCSLVPGLGSHSPSLPSLACPLSRFFLPTEVFQLEISRREGIPPD